MFNMSAIGKKLVELRKKSNMTQVELADKLNVSFQAVSNWERGNSMPDISKLPEISSIFNISLDELLGNKSKLIEASINNNIESYIDNDISEEEFIDTLPILPPAQIETIVKKVDISNYKNIDEFLPFLDSFDIKEFAEKAFDNGQSIDDFLPFLNSSDIKEFAEKAFNSGKSIDDFLPFLDSSDIKKFANAIMENYKN